jgi:hypothetical protein
MDQFLDKIRIRNSIKELFLLTSFRSSLRNVPHVQIQTSLFIHEDLHNPSVC